MLHINAPALIKIREGITVNISQSVSQAVEKQVPQRRLKEGVRELCEKEKRAPQPDEYEAVGNADTLSFWFMGGTSLSYRVGEEITQKDFDRIANILTNLQYQVKK